jgi:hypothetical protein
MGEPGGSCLRYDVTLNNENRWKWPDEENDDFGVKDSSSTVVKWLSSTVFTVHVKSRVVSLTVSVESVLSYVLMDTCQDSQDHLSSWKSTRDHWDQDPSDYVVLTRGQDRCLTHDQLIIRFGLHDDFTRTLHCKLKFIPLPRFIRSEDRFSFLNFTVSS